MCCCPAMCLGTRWGGAPPSGKGSRGDGGGCVGREKGLKGWFHREQRHLSPGAHASAVRGPSPLGWLASQSRGIERETD